MNRIPFRIVLPLIAVIAVSAVALAGAPLAGVDPASGEDRTVAVDGPLTHVVFFATWCPPCLAEFAALRDLEARWKPDGYRLVLVAIDQRENQARIARFLDDELPPGEVLFDRGGALQARFRLETVPGHILLGAGGDEMLRASSLDEGVAAAVERHLGSR
ncbi:MAG: TlpA family protein disulfide reductase [Acidobacteria bacterium]|jgi:thiol-disulfide isomerase/thioredoxin|uniref:TlpA family protein disulfide reductase n=1 Tax=Candidatus Polarisedimenticola svalbardensis TaxID=2886004 RepID=A0A8J6XS39_9BACT|nr:TlpA family protein disulfide reductase [Candidatus Polarisedimenticola svalbardensis]